jgi:serine kinase of HPr protein (carbohydrate metabolism regulator)
LQLTSDTIRNSIIRSTLVHAAAVETASGAILFLGHSGAGKSTLASKVSDFWPIIADDIVYLGKSAVNHIWYVADAKKINLSRIRFFPLFSFIRIFQSSTPEIKTITSLETCRHLTDSIFEIEIMKGVNKKIQHECFKITADVARNYTGWQLYATLGKETLSKLFENFPIDGQSSDKNPILS